MSKVQNFKCSQKMDLKRDGKLLKRSSDSVSDCNMINEFMASSNRCSHLIHDFTLLVQSMELSGPR
ncbi:hypothetical protein DY000_02014716 [Brassica cretica]|uniref:Uncharacterized protein n=1 Tax=Brassica cretica TaxID=69181 RepID=A0ABQ7D5C3_BRACR|nr:hypothetical protein DY000_02014716 [Brassica cretica]